MASDGVPATKPASVTPASQASKTPDLQLLSGRTLPPGGNGARDTAGSARAEVTATVTNATATKATSPGGRAPSKTPTVSNKADLESLVSQLNKYLNNSGRPNQFRVDPNSQNQIQEINPASGEVIGQFSTVEFPALARSLGVSGVLVDDHA